MDEKKDNFEIFNDYPNEQESNPAILNDAKKLAQELYGYKAKEKQKKTVIFSTVIASVMTCVLFLSIFLPIYFKDTKETEKKYYATESIFSKDVEDIETVISENALAVKFFKIENAMISNTASYFKENNKIAFLYQQLIVIGEEGFDNVTLGIIPSDDEFEEFDKFNNLDKNEIIQEISVDYKNETIETKTIITAKFKYEKTNYYLTITAVSITGKLDSYVKLLLN